jgi:hypothetical protein
MHDTVKFILLLVLDIPAIIISVLSFVYFNSHRAARSKPKNHVWLVLLIVIFLQLIINLPMPMSFYYLGRIWPRTDAYCVWWTWYEYSSNAASLILMAWTSIERHFFVFHPRLLVGAQWKKWTYHFGPIIFCILWPSLWYLALVVVTPDCDNVWDFDQVICGIPCFEITNNEIYGSLDLLFNIAIPLCIIIVANLALIARVIYETISRHQVIHWRRHCKMAFQLWFISSLYLAGWLPFALTQLIQITAIPSFMVDQLETIFSLVYFIPLLLPVVYLGVFPQIMKNIRTAIGRQRRNRVDIIRVLPTQ